MSNQITILHIVDEFSSHNDRHLLHVIIFNQHLIIQKQNTTMANVADLQASVDALSAQVAAIPQAGTPPPAGISETDLDPIKAGIDSATAAIAAKLTPA